MNKQLASLIVFLWSLPLTAQELVVNFDVVGLNSNQINLNEALNNACTSISQLEGPTAAQSTLLSACSLVAQFNEEDPQLANILDQLIPEEVFAISDSMTDASDLQITNIYSRIHKLQLVQAGVASLEHTGSSQYANNGIPETGGSASSDGSLVSKLQLFASGYVSSGEYEGAEFQQNADISSNSLSIGLDYRVRDNFIVGAGVGFLQTDSAFQNNSGSVNSDGVNLTLFGTFSFLGTAYADLVVDAGTNSFEMSRSINISGLADIISASETDASTFSLSGSLGKNFSVRGWNLGPYARGSYTSASVDAFTETVSSSVAESGIALRVDSQSITSTTIALGAQISKTFSTSKAVVIPQLNLEFETETNSDKDNLNAYFLADPDQNLVVVDGDERDSSYMNIGIGGSAIFAGGKSAFVFVETRLQHEFLTQSWLKAGFRWEF